MNQEFSPEEIAQFREDSPLIDATYSVAEIRTMVQDNSAKIAQTNGFALTIAVLIATWFVWDVVKTLTGISKRTVTIK